MNNMAEININIAELEDSIARLRSLQTNAASAPPATVGGGQTVNELENIADTYRALNRSLSELISNTIHFLDNIKESYMTSDQLAARGIDQ